MNESSEPDNKQSVTQDTGSTQLLRRLGKVLLIVVSLFIFILALRILIHSAGVFGPHMLALLRITSPINTLGFGWLCAYVVLSGAPVAGIALSLFASGALTPVQTLTMVTGSRLGADMIVLFVGFIYYLRGHPRDTSIALGVIAQTVTVTTYLPALPLGYWLLTSHVLDAVRISMPPAAVSLIALLIDPLVDMIARLLPAWLMFFVGVVIILIAFRLLDRALPQITAEQRAFGRIGQLVYRPWAMFALGTGVTLVGMSVSVSLSLLVPLTARGLIRRDNVVPYVLGTNIATLIDKLVPALLVNNPLAVTIILAEMFSVTAVSCGILLFGYRPYERTILSIQRWVIESNWGLAIFMTVMIAVPLTLMFL